MPEFQLTPRSVFDAVGGCRVEGNGITFDEAPARTMLSLSTRKGQETRLRAAIKKSYGLALPGPGTFAATDDMTAYYAGPEQWFLSSENNSLTKLTAITAALASVTDQSDSFAALSLGGPLARDVLMRLTSVDLDDAMFPSGSVTRTAMQQISVMIARVGDGPDYVLNTPRSTARGFADDVKTAITTLLAR